MLSACTCAFFVRELIAVFWMWILLMGLMGAIAGGVGGFIGWRAKQGEEDRWLEERFEDD